MLTYSDYGVGVLTKDASEAGGVVTTLACLLPRIAREARRKDEAIADSRLLRLFVHRLEELTRHVNVGEAFEHCLERSNVEFARRVLAMDESIIC